jgi:hypothetical protein
MSAALTDYLQRELTRKLANLPTDNERYRCLILQSNVWQAKYRRFFAASCLAGDLPAEFSFGPYGWITAGDFLIVLGMIDAARTKMERAPVPA